MVDVITEITIEKDIRTVADFSANPDNAPLWYVNIKSVEWITGKPLEAGSQIAFKARFLGRELAYIYEVAEYINNERLVMRTSQGPFPMETTYSWKPLGKMQTRMSLRNAGQPTGFSKLLSPFMQIMIKRANNKDLSKLKRILES